MKKVYRYVVLYMCSDFSSNNILMYYLLYDIISLFL